VAQAKTNAAREDELRIRLYGRLAEAIGPEIELAGADCTVGELRERLAASHSSVARTLATSRALIANRTVDDDRRVGGSDELEFLPPVSGG
jgi:molybdopterin converting factor small subunit